MTTVSLPSTPTLTRMARRAVALLFLLLVTSAARAQNFVATHYAELSSYDVVPPTTSFGQGIAMFALDPVGKRLQYYIAVIDLSADIASAHLNTGAYGQTGPQIRTINFAGKHTASGTIESLTDQEMLALSTGGVYIEIETAGPPAGPEIRGQISPFPNLGAELRSTAEVPPADSSDGSGVGEFLLDLPNRTLYYAISWDDLTGKVTMAHFHKGAPGVAGDVVKSVTVTGSDSSSDAITGVWSDLTDQDLAALMAGEIYFNVHTAKYGSGELRGQIYPLNYYTAEVRDNIASVPTPVGAGLVRAFLSPGFSQMTGTFLTSDLSEPADRAFLRIAPDADLASELNRGFSNNEWSLFDVQDPDTIRGWAARGLWVDFTTSSHPDGAARGILMPVASNLNFSVASVPVLLPGAVAGGLSAWYDRSAGAVTFALPSGAAHRDGTIALYSPLGRQVASTSLGEGSSRIDVGPLPAGIYFAQLVVDGRPVAVCRVPVLR